MSTLNTNNTALLCAEGLLINMTFITTCTATSVTA